ncbi:MAG: transposase [Deltaproteobacteria bacterium]|nr:transposase [Deltaproteobacteria bacterium]
MDNIKNDPRQTEVELGQTEAEPGQALAEHGGQTEAEPGQDLNNPSTSPLPGYIGYEKRSTGLFAKHYLSTYVRNGSVYHKNEYLGKVENKEQGIFKSRKRGVFSFNLIDGYGTASTYVAPTSVVIPPLQIFDFGGIWMIDQILKQSGLDHTLENLIPENIDTLKSLLGFKLLETKSNHFAADWYQKSYARVLYPEAIVDSPRISELLSILGSDYSHTKFFEQYLGTILKDKSIAQQVKIPVIIDSVGIQNDITTYLTALSNHGNGANNELRVTYVVDKNTRLPIFFRISVGNIIDNSLLIGTIHQLRTFGIEVDLVIMDAGYSAFDNISELVAENISFLTIMPQNRIEYKQLIEEHSQTLRCSENMIPYGNRALYVKKVNIDYMGHKLFAYVMLDIKQASDDLIHAAIKYDLDKDRNTLISKEELNAGKFVLLSSREYSQREVVKEYKTRQTIEQIFDINKNYAGGMPLRAHTEETIRGSILISFITTVIYTIISQKLSGTRLSALAALSKMDQLRMIVHEHGQFTEELTKDQNIIFKHISLDNPVTDFCSNGINKKNFAFADLNSKRRGRGRPKKIKNSPVENTPNGLVSNSDEIRPNSDGSRRRGRPKGSKNRPKAGIPNSFNSTSVIQSAQDSIEEELLRRRGRPKGSKNRPKIDTTIAVETKVEGLRNRGRGRPKGSKNKSKRAYS